MAVSLLHRKRLSPNPGLQTRRPHSVLLCERLSPTPGHQRRAPLLCACRSPPILACCRLLAWTCTATLETLNGGVLYLLYLTVRVLSLPCLIVLYVYDLTYAYDEAIGAGTAGGSVEAQSSSAASSALAMLRLSTPLCTVFIWAVSCVWFSTIHKGMIKALQGATPTQRLHTHSSSAQCLMHHSSPRIRRCSTLLLTLRVPHFVSASLFECLTIRVPHYASASLRHRGGVSGADVLEGAEADQRLWAE